MFLSLYPYMQTVTLTVARTEHLQPNSMPKLWAGQTAATCPSALSRGWEDPTIPPSLTQSRTRLRTPSLSIVMSVLSLFGFYFLSPPDHVP